MTPEQKQSELQRHRAILLATCDYLLKRNRGCFVVDGADHIAESFEQEKEQIEEKFKQENVSWLQQLLKRRTAMFRNRVDLQFVSYIKEETGYEIDMFSDLRNRVKAIVAQKEIRNQKELDAVVAMQQYYHKTAVDGEEVEKLKSLLSDYAKGKSETLRGRKDVYSEVVSRIEKEGIEEVTVRVSTGPKPKHFKEHEAISPNGKLRLRVVQWGDGEHASTYVNLTFPTASGPVFGMSGIHDVRAFWKNNSSIVIETPPRAAANTQYKQVQSFEDLITIEYVVHSPIERQL